jgi:tetratricopeptide (TPR) repeat protein
MDNIGYRGPRRNKFVHDKAHGHSTYMPELQSISEMIDKGKYKKALSILEKVESKYEIMNNGYFYSVKAKALDSCGMSDKAVKACDEALSKGLQDGVIYLVKAKALNNMGKHKEAHETCDKALKKGYMEVQLFNMDAQALDGMCEYEAAIKVCDEAIANETYNEITCNMKAIALDHMGMHEESVRECEKIISRGIANVFTYTAMARSLLNMGRHEKALEECEKAITAGYIDGGMYTAKAKILDHMGQWEKAEKAYFYCIDTFGESFEVLENLLEHFLAAKEENKIRETLDKVCKFNCRKIENFDINGFDLFSDHFTKRLKERNISKEKLLESIGKYHVGYHKFSKTICYTIIDNNLIKVVANTDNKTIITAWEELKCADKDVKPAVS